MGAPNPPKSGEPEHPASVADLSAPTTTPRAQEIDVLAFVAGQQRFAVELHTVEEVFSTGHITPVPLSPVCVRGATNLRGQLVILVDVGALTSGTPAERVLPGTSAVLVQRAHFRAGLLLDRVIDVLSVPLARYEERTDGGLIAGQFKGAGGSLELLDVEAALEEVQHRSALNAASLMTEEIP